VALASEAVPSRRDCNEAFGSLCKLRRSGSRAILSGQLQRIVMRKLSIVIVLNLFKRETIEQDRFYQLVHSARPFALGSLSFMRG
jgi:hypothetical protein